MNQDCINEIFKCCDIKTKLNFCFVDTYNYYKMGHIKPTEFERDIVERILPFDRFRGYRYVAYCQLNDRDQIYLKFFISFLKHFRTNHYSIYKMNILNHIYSVKLNYDNSNKNGRLPSFRIEYHYDIRYDDCQNYELFIKDDR